MAIVMQTTADVDPTQKLCSFEEDLRVLLFDNDLNGGLHDHTYDYGVRLLRLEFHI